MADGDLPEILAKNDLFLARSVSLNLASILEHGFDIKDFDV